MSTSATPTERELRAQEFLHNVHRATAHLRGTLDAIDALAEKIHEIPAPGTISAGLLAARMVHDLQWGIANASTDSIVTAAADFDYFTTKD